MAKKNVVLERVMVEDYAAEGKGLARHEGKVIFIQGVVPGDLVDVQLSKNKKDWAEGRVLRTHLLSADRVDPFCQHFGTCGGCKWQMLPYEKQLFYKQNEVEQHLKRIGKVELPPIAPIIGCESTRFYRNKLEFTFSNKRYLMPNEMEQTDHPHQPAVGFHVPRIFDKVIDINTCHLMDEPANLVRNTVRAYALAQNISFYDVRQHTGWLRNLIVRNSTLGETMVNLCVGYEDDDAIKSLFEHLLERVPGITTLLYTINKKWNDSLYDLQPIAYKGPGFITERLEDFEFRISPKSFFQTNSRQGERLYQVTRDFAQLTGSETVYDLYCGTGSIGIFLSRQAKRVVGVETVDDAVHDARVNAEINHLEHASFFSGDVIDICTSSFFEQQGTPDVVITDPPRAGMHDKLVTKLLEIGAPRIVYVSCNPATQARDLALLDARYQVTRVQPVDMFPHTHHIENVVQLTLRN